jgi:hypothetical protein
MRRSGATIRYGAGRLLVFAGALAAGWSALTLVSGGLALPIGPLALSFRDPVRPLVVAGILVALGRAFLPGSEFRRAVQAVTGDRDHLAARSAAAAAGCVLVFSIAWRSAVAGGSDSACYVLQAEAFAHGRATLANPVARVLPDAPGAVFAPTGFVPSRAAPAEAVPICGPGLALAMAGAFLIHRDAVFLIVPVTAALLVWLTFVFGRRVDGQVTGACAAVLLACSPIFLYQSVQPMSDVPAAALWLAALVLASGRRPMAAGLCASLTVLVRANLALVVVPLFFLLPDRRAWVRFAVATAPGLAIMIGLNLARYGAPLASGYGDTGVLFSLAHLAPNAARYPRWLLETETPFVLLAVAAPWWVARHRDRAPLAAVSLASAALIGATYLAYTVFEDWWYIRFLLPALPVVLVFSVAVALDGISRLVPAGGRSRAVRTAVAVGLCAALGGWYLHVARDRHVLDLQALESRFAIAGRYAGRALPPSAVVLAVQESASVRFHGGRDTIAWDGIAPDALDRTIETLRAAGRLPSIALEDQEEPRFRARFAGQRFGGLDWPPHAEINAPVRVRLYDTSDLERYRGGEAIATAHVRD